MKIRENREREKWELFLASLIPILMLVLYYSFRFLIDPARLFSRPVISVIIVTAGWAFFAIFKFWQWFYSPLDAALEITESRIHHQFGRGSLFAELEFEKIRSIRVDERHQKVVFKAGPLHRIALRKSFFSDSDWRTIIEEIIPAVRSRWQDVLASNQ